MTHTQIPPGSSLEAGRVLDAAKGILVAMRRCTLSEAFSEILEVAALHEVGVLSVCRALIELAENGTPSGHGLAGEVTVRTWGQVFPARQGRVGTQ